jgi:hypothetical protein
MPNMLQEPWPVFTGGSLNSNLWEIDEGGTGFGGGSGHGRMLLSGDNAVFESVISKGFGNSGGTAKVSVTSKITDFSDVIGYSFVINDLVVDVNGLIAGLKILVSIGGEIVIDTREIEMFFPEGEIRNPVEFELLWNRKGNLTVIADGIVIKTVRMFSIGQLKIEMDMILKGGGPGGNVSARMFVGNNSIVVNRIREGFGRISNVEAPGDIPEGMPVPVSYTIQNSSADGGTDDDEIFVKATIPQAGISSEDVFRGILPLDSPPLDFTFFFQMPEEGANITLEAGHLEDNQDKTDTVESLVVGSIPVEFNPGILLIFTLGFIGMSYG